MSDDTLQPENYPPSTHSPVKGERKLVKKLSQNEDQRTIINVFSNDGPEKTDKVVQTESSNTAFKKVILFNQQSFTKIKGVTTSPITQTDFKDSGKEKTEENKKNTLRVTRPLHVSVSPEKSRDNPMEPRKSAKSSINSENMTRKKLEAELKAAEEIAKIKETVIEKRLALELASLEDSFDCHPVKKAPPSPPPPHIDKKPAEELPKRKVLPVLQQVAQGPETCYEYSFNRPVSTRLPTLSTSGFTRQHSPIAAKILKTDSSAVLASLKNLTLADKRFNMDEKFYGFNDDKTPSPTTISALRDFSCIDTGCAMAKRHTEYHQKQKMSPCSNSQQNRARMVWKSAMTKIKRKMRTKSPPA